MPVVAIDSDLALRRFERHVGQGRPDRGQLGGARATRGPGQQMDRDVGGLGIGRGRARVREGRPVGLDEVPVRRSVDALEVDARAQVTAQPPRRRFRPARARRGYSSPPAWRG